MNTKDANPGIYSLAADCVRNEQEVEAAESGRALSQPYASVVHKLI